MRWFFRILIVILILLGLAALAVTLVLQSDYPRELVQQTLADELKLRARIEKFHTGWRGRATFENVTLTLPLEDEPLVTLRQMQVDHTGLLWLMITRKLELHSVVIDGATLRLVQREGGRWNVQDLLDRLPRGDGSGEQQADIPDIELRQVRVELTTAEGKHAVYEPLAGTIEPRDGAVALTASLPEVVNLSAVIDRGGEMRHTLKLKLNDAVPLLTPWLEDVPRPLAASLSWAGRLPAGQLTGRAKFESLRAGEIEASGEVGVETGEDVLATLTPRSLSIRLPQGDVQLVGGKVRVSAEVIRVDQLRVDAVGSHIRLNGAYDIVMDVAEVEGGWTGDIEEPRVGHEGAFTARLTQPLPGKRELTLNLRTSGEMEQGAWTVVMVAELAGESFTQLRGPIALPQAEWRREGETLVALRDMRGQLAVTEQEVALTNIHFADPEPFAGSVRVNLNTRQWRAEGKLAELALPEWSNRPLSLSLEADGDTQRANFKIAQVRFGRWSAEAAGVYVLKDPKPLTAKVELGLDVLPPPPGDPPPATTPPPAGKEQDVADPPLKLGTWQWAGNVHGTVAPLDVEADGVLRAKGVVLNRRALPPIETPVIGTVTEQTAALAAPGLEIWGGMIATKAQVDLAASRAQLALEIARLDVQQASPYFFDKSLASGRLEGRIDLSVPLEEPLAARMKGQWSVRDLAFGPIAAETAEGRIDLHRGIAVLDAVRIRQGEGRAEGMVTYNLNTRRDLTLELNVQQYPLVFDEQRLSLSLDGTLAGRVDTEELRGSGKVDLDAGVVFRDEDVGHALVRGVVNGRTLQLERVETQGPLGRIVGSMTIDLDQWQQSTGQLTMEKLDVPAIAALFGFADEVTGRISGWVGIEKAQQERAPEPMRFQGRLDPMDVTLRGVPVTLAEFVGYAGPRRVMIQESRLHLAGGAADLWTSVSRRDNSWFYHVQADLETLQLQPLYKAVSPGGRDIVGEVSGKLQAFGDISDPLQVTGGANLRLKNSDLLGANLMNSIFAALDLLHEAQNEVGQGVLDLRVEAGMLLIDRFRYVNQSLYLWGDGRIAALTAGLDSPIEAFVVGTSRPFRTLPLPGAKFLDKLLTNLQAAVSTVYVTGTIDEPRTQLVPLQQAQRTLEQWFKSEQPAAMQ